MMSNENLVFDWRWKDYGLIATPEKLVHLYDDEPNTTIDFVKYYNRGSDKFRYSIGYFRYNSHEPCWEFKFVGDRFKDIASEDLPVIWKYLSAAYDVLTEWKNQSENL